MVKCCMLYALNFYLCMLINIKLIMLLLLGDICIYLCCLTILVVVLNDNDFANIACH